MYFITGKFIIIICPSKF